MSRFSFFQIEKLTSLMTQDTVTGQELPALSDEVVGVIKAHLSLGEETDKFDGILIEIVDPSNPLLTSTNTSHVLCSYPGTMFSPSVYAVSVATQSKTLNVPTFSNYAAVYETTSSRLAKEMLTMHRPKIIVSLGKDTHSAKLAKEFGLDHVNATTLQSGSTDNETTLSLISKAVAASANTRGILIDGFPNSGAEAKALEEAVGPVSAVLNFNASFITNNSVAAIKRRLLGITDELQPVERPVVKHFGAKVIPIQGNGDEESAYQEAWSKLFAAGIFNRDQNIVVSIGSGSFPAEANMLSSQLAKDYNLSLVRLGEAKLQSEALVAKCLEFFQAQQEQSKHITRLEQQLYDLMSLQQEKEEEAGIIHIFQKQQETKEVDLLRSQTPDRVIRHFRKRHCGLCAKTPFSSKIETQSKMTSTFTYSAIYGYWDGGKPCQQDWIERIDLKAAKCTVPTTSSLNSTCTFLPKSSVVSPGNWTVQTGCLSSADVTTLGKDIFGSLSPSFFSRVQFWSYDTADCSGAPSSISEINSAVAVCVMNVQGLADPSGSIYVAEKVSLGFDGTIWRNYYSDASCSQLFTSIKFNDSTSCVSKMKAVSISQPSFTERILYKGPGCTNPSSVRYSFGREVCGLTGCDTNVLGQVFCPSTNTLAAESKALFADDNNYVTLTTYVDSKCSVFDYSESIRLDTCQPITFSATDNPTAFQGQAYKANITGNNIIYTVYSDGAFSIRGVDAATYSQATGSSSSSSNAGLIGGIVGGVVVVILLIIGSVYYYRKSKRYTPETPAALAPAQAPESAPSLNYTRPGSTLSTNTGYKISDTPLRSETELSEASAATRTDTTNQVVGSRQDTIHVMYMGTSLPSDPVAEKEKTNPLFANLAGSIVAAAAATPPTRTYNTFSKDEKEKDKDTLERGQTVARSSNPEDWSIAQVADWVSKNGGTRDPVFDQRIDGVALMALTLDELYAALKISTVGDRVKFKRGMEALTLAPPTYSE
ncbi:hypothetical protein HDU99_001161 [Rhizoclosmatium hyalinum]|nr:hypothetical protein HDU99_001161 [Rhizoclosmatium hyalinum]